MPIRVLNPEAVAQVVRCFEDPAVGCVAGEKRVAGTGIRAPPQRKASTGNTSRSSRGAGSPPLLGGGGSGELFAVRRELWQTLREDTLLDDFVCSMLIAAQGYRIAYCKGSLCAGEPFGRHGRRRQTQEAHRGGRAAIGMAAAQAAQSVPLRGAVVPVRIAPRAALDADPRSALSHCCRSTSRCCGRAIRRSMPRSSPCNAHSTWPPSRDGRWSAAGTATGCSSSPTIFSS